jgi:hypothetical protein
VALPGLIGLKDYCDAITMFGEVAIEAVHGEVELTVLVPADAEVIFPVGPVSGLDREFVPGQPPRLVQPKPVRIGIREIVQFLQFARSDPRFEIVWDGMDARTHTPRLMSMTKR